MQPNPTLDDEIADVCIIGLGYVGLTLATAFALAGLRVAGVEKNDTATAQIAAGISPFHEDGLDAALAQVVAAGNLNAVGVDAPLPAAKAYVITVGTPVRQGKVHLGDLESALVRVATHMPDGALVVLRSTVRVGTTSGIARSVLDAAGRPFSLAMAPERTIEGRALAELRSLPQIVGGIDEHSADLATGLFARLGVEIVRVGSVEAAELAKLSSNTYRDLQFAFANELAYLADAFGVNVFDVIRACNYGYERMNVALPGPVAGPCLEKDAYILADSAARFGTEASLAMTGRRTNEALVDHVIGVLHDEVTAPPSAVGILGIAFKGRPATSDVRGSMAGYFAGGLRAAWPQAEVTGWDPLVSAEDSASIGVRFDDLKEVLAGVPVLIVQTNHPYFAEEEFLRLLSEHAAPGSIVVDLWNQLPSAITGRDDMRVLTLGRMKVAA